MSKNDISRPLARGIVIDNLGVAQHPIAYMFVNELWIDA
jgi:hypothetical protein